jgi:hypothetical protein
MVLRKKVVVVVLREAPLKHSFSRCTSTGFSAAMYFSFRPADDITALSPTFRASLQQGNDLLMAGCAARSQHLLRLVALPRSHANHATTAVAVTAVNASSFCFFFLF